MKMSVRREFFFLILLLGAIGVAGWIVANKASSGEITSSKQVAVVHTRLLRSPSHSLRATDDDFSSGFQPRFHGVGVLSFSTSPLAAILPAPARAGKDLLTLIRSRRE
jgi:hypothetical protein